MADWNTHLYCAHRVNQELQFAGKDMDEFLFGNLLPDVNMGWIITPEVRLEQADTHFDAIGQEYFWAPLRFYEKYKNEIDEKDPLCLGYLFHLWIDVSLMTNFVSKIPMSQMISDYHGVRAIKWKDAGLFIKKYKFPLSSENIDDIVKHSKVVDEINVTKEDLIKVVEYSKANLQEYSADEYCLYTKEEFAVFYEKICCDFIAWVKSLPQ